jgi:hypothetical protein
MNDVFAPGEVVHLKSGSPLLTVESIKKENGNINTCWSCPTLRCSSNISQIPSEIKVDAMHRPFPFHRRTLVLDIAPAIRYYRMNDKRQGKVSRIGTKVPRHFLQNAHNACVPPDW